MVPATCLGIYTVHVLDITVVIGILSARAPTKDILRESSDENYPQDIELSHPLQLHNRKKYIQDLGFV